MSIYFVSNIRKCVAKHTLSVIFIDLIFFAEVRECMAAIVRGVVLSYANASKKSFHISSKSIGAAWQDLSILIDSG